MTNPPEVAYTRGMRAWRLTDEHLTQWQAQVAQGHGTQRALDWLRTYPQDAWKLMTRADTALTGKEGVEFERAMLCFFAQAEFRHMPEDERRGLQRGAKRFIEDLVRRHPDPGEQHDLLRQEGLDAPLTTLEMRGLLSVLERSLPDDSTRSETFQALVEGCLEWIGRTWAAQESMVQVGALYDELMVFGRNCPLNAARNSCLSHWMGVCQKHHIHDLAVAGRMLTPLLDRGLDLNKIDDQGKPVWLAAAKIPDDQIAQTLLMVLLERGAECGAVQQYDVTPRAWEIIQSHVQPQPELAYNGA